MLIRAVGGARLPGDRFWFYCGPCFRPAGARRARDLEEGEWTEGTIIGQKAACSAYPLRLGRLGQRLAVDDLRPADRGLDAVGVVGLAGCHCQAAAAEQLTHCLLRCYEVAQETRCSRWGRRREWRAVWVRRNDQSVGDWWRWAWGACWPCSGAAVAAAHRDRAGQAAGPRGPVARWAPWEDTSA